MAMTNNEAKSQLIETKPLHEMENPSERYEQLVKSGATAISSEMMFGEGNDPKLKE